MYFFEYHVVFVIVIFFFFFKQKTAYEMRISDWSSDVCSSDLIIIIMVPDTPHVEEVLFSSAGVAEGLSSGKIVVDMSSISPMATKDFACRIKDRKSVV